MVRCLWCVEKRTKLIQQQHSSLLFISDLLLILLFSSVSRILWVCVCVFSSSFHLPYFGIIAAAFFSSSSLCIFVLICDIAFPCLSSRFLLLLLLLLRMARSSPSCRRLLGLAQRVRRNYATQMNGKKFLFIVFCLQIAYGFATSSVGVQCTLALHAGCCCTSARALTQCENIERGKEIKSSIVAREISLSASRPFRKRAPFHKKICMNVCMYIVFIDRSVESSEREKSNYYTYVYVSIDWIYILKVDWTTEVK